MSITLPEIPIPDLVVEDALRREMSIMVILCFDPRAVDKTVFVGLMDPLVSAGTVAALLKKAREITP